ncbi:MAG: hypothetical protein WBE48_24040 [Xanthobacteraceae bacterium]
MISALQEAVGGKDAELRMIDPRCGFSADYKIPGFEIEFRLIKECDEVPRQRLGKRNARRGRRHRTKLQIANDAMERGRLDRLLHGRQHRQCAIRADHVERVQDCKISIAEQLNSAGVAWFLQRQQRSDAFMRNRSIDVDQNDIRILVFDHVREARIRRQFNDVYPGPPQFRREPLPENEVLVHDEAQGIGRPRSNFVGIVCRVGFEHDHG